LKFDNSIVRSFILFKLYSFKFYNGDPMSDTNDKVQELKNLRVNLILFLSFATTLYFFAKIVFKGMYGVPVETGTNILIDILRTLVLLPVYIIGEFIRGLLNPLATAVGMKFGRTIGDALAITFTLISYFASSCIVWGAYIYVGIEIIIQYTKRKIKEGKEITKTIVKKRLKKYDEKDKKNEEEQQ